MTQNPPAGCQRVIPYLAYRDAPAAIEFLCEAFGFAERFRFEDGDGRIGHAELGYQDNVLMLASVYEEIGMASPADLPATHAQVMCYVDDVDAHYARAVAAGATIVDELADKPYGDRMYAAKDPEGQRWYFASRVRDAPPEDLQP